MRKGTGIMKTPKPLLALRMVFPLAASLIVLLLGEGIARGSLSADVFASFIFPHIGAYYAITQLFYDNEKFYAFVEKARQMGITIPIVPALKPFAKLSQLTMVPKTFHCDIPEALAQEVLKCKSDEDAKALGIEWTTAGERSLRSRIQSYPFLHRFSGG